MYLVFDSESVALDDLLKEALLLAGVHHQRVVALLGQVRQGGGQHKREGKNEARRGNGQDFGGRPIACHPHPAVQLVLIQVLTLQSWIDVHRNREITPVVFFVILW